MITDDEKTEGIMEGLKVFFLVGPLMTLFHVACALTDTVIIDMIVHRTCIVSLNVNATECYGLRVNAAIPEAIILEAKVEPHTSMIVMSKSFIEIILPAVITLFLGSWSDRFGRRPLFLATFYGRHLVVGLQQTYYDSPVLMMCQNIAEAGSNSVQSCVIKGLTSSCVLNFLLSNWDLSPWYLLIALLPLEIVGSSYTMKLATDCYVADIATVGHRSLNYALFKGLDNISKVLGRMIGMFIYRESGYTSVFGTAAICGILGILHTHFFVSESLKIHSEKSKSGIFTVSNVIDPFVSSVTKRKGFNRPVAWLGIICVTVSPVIGKGSHNIEFLFTRARLGWDVQQYSYFSSVHSVLQLIGLSGVLLGSYVSDTLLAGLSISSKVGAALTKSLAWQTWHMYLAVGIETFNGLLRPVMRTLISKAVPAEDIGKIFALISLLQLLNSFALTPLLTFIYFNYLPPIYPSPVFLFSTSLYILLLIFVVCMEILTRKSSNGDTYSAAAQEDFECSEDEPEVKEDIQNTLQPQDAQIRQDS